MLLTLDFAELIHDPHQLLLLLLIVLHSFVSAVGVLSMGVCVLLFELFVVSVAVTFSAFTLSFFSLQCTKDTNL